MRIRRGRVDDVRDRFDHPLALAVDPSRDLLVADWGRGVIYSIAKETLTSVVRVCVWPFGSFATVVDRVRVAP